MKNCKNIYLHKLLQFSVLGDGMVPLGPDGHLVTRCLMTEAGSGSWSWMTGAKTLRSAVRDLVVAVKTQERVVAARTVMTTWMFARVKAPTSRVVSRGVLDTGRKSKILLVSQTPITSGLAVHVPVLGHVHGLRAPVMTLRQHGEKLGVNKTRKNNGRTRVPQLRGALGYRLRIRK